MPQTIPDLNLVLDQIRADAAANRFAPWGWSTVVDEHVGKAIIDPALFDRLHDAAGIQATFPIGNAGVIHVYGYWFSTVLTPYGYKRDRWLDGDLSGALGLPDDAFHLHHTGSTLLKRVTSAALPLLLAVPGEAATPSQAEPSFQVAIRGEAEVRLSTVNTRMVIVGTDETSALIYGVNMSKQMQLITCFPVNGNPDSIVRDFLTDRRLHWNAAIPDASSPTVHPHVDT
ncbi:hypothetical protein [Gulosibacter molinativorax]|uniref:Amino acid deaminase n=1 Tax=Gulosibacter molinativorax TaxID=256821 RepID=A0ABT7C647_9MICO|nr:hypothetical protein [Gulosibacter molinativorax]MDJ1370688.1 amino acid deaminase [Gulosibacter molinativorax]QUY63285.1 Putative helicase [Gulosibacter molinativorax]